MILDLGLRLTAVNNCALFSSPLRDKRSFTAHRMKLGSLACLKTIRVEGAGGTKAGDATEKMSTSKRQIARPSAEVTGEGQGRGETDRMALDR